MSQVPTLLKRVKRVEVDKQQAEQIRKRNTKAWQYIHEQTVLKPFKAETRLWPGNYPNLPTFRLAIEESEEVVI